VEFKLNYISHQINATCNNSKGLNLQEKTAEIWQGVDGYLPMSVGEQGQMQLLVANTIRSTVLLSIL